MGEHDAPIEATIWTKEFWRQASDRAIKTFASTLGVLLIGPATLAGTGVAQSVSIPWQAALSAAATLTVVSLLMSVGGKKIGDPNDPAWLPRRR